MVFRTKNSTYELDTARSRIRRLYGAHAPRSRQGTDGEWREYHYVSPIEVGKGVLVLWDDEGHGTQLSRVTAVDVAVN